MKTNMLRALLVVVLTPVSGCVVGWLTPPHEAPRMAGTVAAVGTRPLLVDWSSNDRTLLNTSRLHGPLVVAFENGRMEPLFECHVKGRYRYTAERSVQVQDDIIDSEDGLHVKMPVFGARFRADLQRAGKLHVRMKVVGTYTANQTTFDRNDLDGNCASASHVATYVTVGAFRLFTLSSGELKGDVAVPNGPEVSGETRKAEQSLNEAGDETACSKASGSDTEPPEGCSTSLQLVLGPIVAGDDPVPPTEQPRSITALAVTGGGALLAGVATIAYLVNDGNFRELRDQCNSPTGCSTTTYDDRSGSIQTWDRLSAGGWLIGGAMLLGGGIWWLSSGTPTAPTQPRFGASLGAGRLQMGGSF